jgi:hypothetical protein
LLILNKSYPPLPPKVFDAKIMRVSEIK